MTDPWREVFLQGKISPIRAPIASFCRRKWFRQGRSVHRHFYLLYKRLFFENTLLNQRKNCPLAGFRQARFLPHILYHLSNLEAAGSPLLPIFQKPKKQAYNRLFEQNTRNSAVNVAPDLAYNDQKSPVPPRIFLAASLQEKITGQPGSFSGFFYICRKKKFEKKIYNVVDFSGELLCINKKSSQPKKNIFPFFHLQKKAAD